MISFGIFELHTGSSVSDSRPPDFGVAIPLPPQFRAPPAIHNCTFGFNGLLGILTIKMYVHIPEIGGQGQAAVAEAAGGQTRA